MAAERIIIDTDPGQDDAIAIMMALASPDLEVVGITTVAGNVPLELTQRNARIVCEVSGVTDVPVFAGCDRPMLRSLVTAEHVHGASGIDGPEITEPTMPLQEQHAVDWLIETILASDEDELTLCPLGPLTNIGMALAREPALADKVREIVLMGGGFFEGGNITPAAEFNIHVDPHAAHIVLTSGIPVTMLPLDVTHKALTSKAWVDSVRALGTSAAVFAADMLDYYEHRNELRYGTEGGPLHDPNVIAYVLDPDLYSGRNCHVAVEHGSSLTMGMTVVDWWEVTGEPSNARVINGVDADGFYALVYDLLALL